MIHRFGDGQHHLLDSAIGYLFRFGPPLDVTPEAPLHVLIGSSILRAFARCSPV